MTPAHIPGLELVICHEVTGLASCTFDELVQRLPAHSWAQVFASVDWLCRQGILAITRTRCFGYVLSIGPDPPLFLRKTGSPGIVRSAELRQPCIRCFDNRHEACAKTGVKGG
jgi:hypothetical protein